MEENAMLKSLSRTRKSPPASIKSSFPAEKFGKSITVLPTTASRATRAKLASLSFVLFLIFLNCFHFGNSAIAETNDSLRTVIANRYRHHGATPNDVKLPSLSMSSAKNDVEPQGRFRSRRSTVQVAISGLRVESSSHEIKYGSDGVPRVLSDSEIVLRVFGSGLTEDTIISFTTTPNDFGGACLTPATALFKTDEKSAFGTTALFKVTLPSSDEDFYLCAKNDPNIEQSNVDKTKPLVHQGKDIPRRIRTFETLLPIWASLIIITVCLCFSALFSGLNLGLMSLDRTELKILRNTGSAREREYAKKIQPVRDQGNFLLCSILLGNVLVNSTFTILLDGLTSGVVAVCCSTLAIVIFGEITPQAICSRHGLAVGAKTILITKTVMAITFPLSWPTSKILDRLLGEEIGNVYNRERLKELVRVTTGINDLDKNEVNIISGALELRKKTVANVMTHIEDAFMLSLDAILDFETVSEIMKSGFSRIPVYEGDRKNIVTLLYIKDLAFVDTDDNTPLRTLCEFYQNPVHFVFEDYTLDIMFNQFKDGTIGHLAFVHRINNEGDGDPFYETIGLVTLEDVIEELIQAEIVDETDVFVDNRTKIRRHRKKQDFSMFAERRENQAIRISPQLTLATFQYLSTAVDAFKKDIISESILRRLLNQDIIHAIKCKGKDKDDPSLYIFQQGKAVDFFVLILEGRVEVTVGKENLLFEAGAFTYFGTQALVPSIVIDSPVSEQQAIKAAESRIRTSEVRASEATLIKGSMISLNMDAKVRQTFVPDYSVRAITDVTYLAVKRNLYMTAKKASLLEKSRKSGSLSAGDVDDEVEKLLVSFYDSENRHRSRENIRKVSIGNRSRNTSASLNDISQQSRSGAANQPNSHGSNSNDIVDGVSLNSHINSEAVNDLNSIEANDRENGATSEPLLPKKDKDTKEAK